MNRRHTKPFRFRVNLREHEILNRKKRNETLNFRFRQYDKNNELYIILFAQKKSKLNEKRREEILLFISMLDVTSIAIHNFFPVLSSSFILSQCLICTLTILSHTEANIQAHFTKIFLGNDQKYFVIKVSMEHLKLCTSSDHHDSYYLAFSLDFISLFIPFLAAFILQKHRNFCNSVH